MIDRKDLLDWAKIATQPPTCETALRAATSRAYYSVYHGCKELQKKPGMIITPSRNMGTHTALYDAMSKVTPAQCSAGVPDRVVHQIAVCASTLKNLRKCADYDIDTPYLAYKSSDAHAKALQINRILDGIL